MADKTTRPGKTVRGARLDPLALTVAFAPLVMQLLPDQPPEAWREIRAVYNRTRTAA